MRTPLKIALAGLLIVVGMAIYGLLTPTISHKATTVVDKPVMAVFTHMIDVKKLPSWMKGLERVEPKGVRLLPGIPSGSYDLYYHRATISHQFQLDIVKVVPLSSALVRFSNDLMNIDCTVTLTAKGNQTEVSVENVATAKGIFAKMALPYVKWKLRSDTDDNVVRFKELIELP